jgi:isoaspartyl peptidase/L-asparaginase-like protein (Ntn-hydrolase superfamily)
MSERDDRLSKIKEAVETAKEIMEDIKQIMRIEREIEEKLRKSNRTGFIEDAKEIYYDARKLKWDIESDLRLIKFIAEVLSKERT